MADFGIPETVTKREFPATGRWEEVRVWDSNWDRCVPGVVRPDGSLDHVYGGFPEGEWLCRDYVEWKNTGVAPEQWSE